MNTYYKIYSQAFENFHQMEGYKYSNGGEKILDAKAHEFALKVMEIEQEKQLREELQVNLRRI